MSGFLRTQQTDIYLPVTIVVCQGTFTILPLTRLSSGGSRGENNAGEGGRGHAGIPSADDHLGFNNLAQWLVEFRFLKFNNSKVSQ